MTAQPKIDLSAQTKEGLRNLLANAKRLGREDVAADVLLEITRRGQGKGDDYALLRWNQETVKQALEPFASVARTVKDNQRTSYTEAGGRKIGRSRDDPDWMWIDSYSAIKSPRLNAVFVGYVPRPGDEAYFELHLDGATERRFPPNELEQAMARWRNLAASA